MVTTYRASCPNPGGLFKGQITVSPDYAQFKIRISFPPNEIENTLSVRLTCSVQSCFLTEALAGTEMPGGEGKGGACTKWYYTFLFSNNCIVPGGFLPSKIRVAFPGESQLRQSRATQVTVHGGCFSVSIIHPTLTWTTGSLTCAQMLMLAIAHGGVRTP